MTVQENRMLINYLAAELTRYYKEKIFLSQQSCGE